MGGKGLANCRSFRIRRHLSFAIAISLSSAALQSARQSTSQLPDEPVPLRLAAAIEREISGAQSNSYHLELEPGQLAVVAIEQRGIDIIAMLTDKDGALGLRVDNDPLTTGDERLVFVAEARGRYVVTVRPSYSVAPAGLYRIHLSEVRPATARDRALHDVRKLRSRAWTLAVQSQSHAAVPIAEQALALADGMQEPDDLETGLAAAMAGSVRDDTEDYPAAHRHYERSHALLAAQLGPDHPLTTVLLSALGSTAARLGDHASAERLLLDALRRQERVFPAGHPIVARTLNNVGNYQTNRGDFSGAERAFKRAATIVTEWLGNGAELHGVIDGNLGNLYLRQRDYRRAEPYLLRSLDTREKLLGPDHAELAIVLNNLGIVARDKGDYAAAERYYTRVLAIREKSVGLDHPSVAGTLNNLANIYSSQGDYEKSLALLLRALAIDEKGATRWSPPILALGNIARRYAALGDLENAFVYQSRVDRAIEDTIAINLAIGSERQKIAYLTSIAERTDRTVSFHLNLQPNAAEASRLAAGVLLQRKGRVLDAMADTLGALRVNAGADERALMERLVDATTRFAQLALTGAGRTSLDEHRRKLQELEQAKEALEIEISQRSDAFRAASQGPTLEAVQRALPSGTALLEFAVYRQFDVKAVSMTVAYGPPRYAVYIITPDTVVGRDLGEAAAIDAEIESFRAAVQDPRRPGLRRVARALDRRIMDPVRAVAGNAARLLISPDGQLSLIPFEALLDASGRYLVQRHAISYLSAGRDVLRLQFPRESQTPPLVVADPLFGEPAPTATSAGAGRTPTTSGSRRRSTTSGTADRLYFAPLAGTREEAERIRTFFPQARVLAGPAATEAALKQARAPSILHIATHGFFLEDEGTNRGAQGTGKERQAPSAGGQGTVIQNPLLRSGVALAGANLTAKKEDGILTALEAAHLNLWGTELVILSACDTGIGVVRNGDGVYGLRRSIFLAGAESLVMSLWPVSDYITREMMTAYYKGVTGGLGRGEALRQVQLAMLKRKGRDHPFYWASFIQAGDWAPLARR
jgi:CHAT domain-containing protein